jgi:hypothetical protein
LAAFKSAVETGDFPNEDETYRLSEEVAEALLKEPASG